MANHISHAALPYPIKGARYTVPIPYLDADGDPTDPTTPDTEISKDGGAFADCAEEVTTITGSNGAGYITLSGAEMDASLIFLCAKVASGPKATLATLVPRVMPAIHSGTADAGGASTITLQSTANVLSGTAYSGMIVRTTGGTGGGGTGGANNQARVITDYNATTRVATVSPAWETAPDATTTYEILRPNSIGIANADVKAFGGTAGTFASGIPQASLTTSAINSVADQVWDEAMSAHVTGGSFGAALQANHSGTMQAGSTGTTAVLASGASSSDDFYNNSLLLIVSGTGAGQSQYISDYTGSTRTATMNGTWVTTPDNTSVYAVLPGGTIPGASAPSAADNAAAVWNALTASYVAAGSFGELFKPIRRNTAQAGTTSSITLDASASATTDFYKYAICYLLSGTGGGQARQVTAYNGTSKVATVAPDWTTAPGADSVFVMLPLGIDAATLASIADAVWDEARSGHATAGTFGEYVLADTQRISGDATAADNLEAATDGTGYGFTGCTMPTVTTLTGHTPQTGDAFARLGTPAGASVSADVAAIVADTNELQLDWADGGRLDLILDARASQTSVDTVDTVVDAILVDTGTDGVLVAGHTTAAKAEINAEVVDVLVTDTFAQPASVPAATSSLKDKINWIFTVLRNKITQTATTQTLRNDGDAADIATSTHSDNGTTHSRGKWT